MENERKKLEESPEKSPEGLTIAILALGDYLLVSENFSKAIPPLEEGVKLMESHFGSIASLATPVGQLAICYWMEGNMSQAEKNARRNLQISLESWEPTHRVVGGENENYVNNCPFYIPHLFVCFLFYFLLANLGDACSLLARILLENEGKKEEIEELLDANVANRIEAYGEYSREALEALEHMLRVAQHFGDEFREEEIREQIWEIESQLQS